MYRARLLLAALEEAEDLVGHRGLRGRGLYVGRLALPSTPLALIEGLSAGATTEFGSVSLRVGTADAGAVVVALAAGAVVDDAAHESGHALDATASGRWGPL